MSKYWKTKESQEAKVTRNKDGALIMKIMGEDEDFPGFPRGHLLFGKLSKLKHEIKNQIFNEAWRKLDEGIPEQDIIQEIRTETFDRIFALAEETKYDQVPPERMFEPVREIYRAWTVVAPGERSKKVRDILTFILQEDDSYRFRFQWMVKWYFNPNTWYLRIFGKDPVDRFEKALKMVEIGEVIGDMKERQRLLKRILMLLLKDPRIRDLFVKFCKEVDWKKVSLKKSDEYHFRAKYFKVDLPLFDY